MPMLKEREKNPVIRRITTLQRCNDGCNKETPCNTVLPLCNSVFPDDREAVL